MSIELTPENLLIQLEYPVKDATLAQLDRIVKNTKGFDKFAKHIISLKDEIRKYSAVVALSNSKDYLKVKCDSSLTSRGRSLHRHCNQDGAISTKSK